MIFANRVRFFFFSFFVTLLPPDYAALLFLWIESSSNALERGIQRYELENMIGFTILEIVVHLLDPWSMLN